LSDLNEAVKVVPQTNLDVRKILLKAIDETENCVQFKQADDNCPFNLPSVETDHRSSDSTQDCNSSGVGSSLSERS
jgi:hypothetical protein